MNPEFIRIANVNSQITLMIPVFKHRNYRWTSTASQHGKPACETPILTSALSPEPCPHPKSVPHDFAAFLYFFLYFSVQPSSGALRAIALLLFILHSSSRAGALVLIYV